MKGCLKFVVISVVSIFAIVAIMVAVSPSSGTTSASRVVSTRTPTPAPTPTLTFTEMLSISVEIDYEQIFRNAEDHEGEYVYGKGEIIQAIYGKEGEGDTFRINLNGNYDETIISLCYCDDFRFMEDDEVSFVGQVFGLYTYKGALGTSITIPRIDIKRMSVVEE